MDCCLPADFFIVDDVRRHDDIDPALGAEAYVHVDSAVFTSGLRDWRHAHGPAALRADVEASRVASTPSRPRGPYPGDTRRRSRTPRARLTDATWPEWRPL